MPVASSHRQGFTLVELLVVVAIIATLIALLLPSLSKARELSKSTVCLSNMRQILIAGHIYATDHDGYMYGYQDNDTSYILRGGEPRHLGTYIASGALDLSSGNVFFCPADRTEPGWNQIADSAGHTQRQRFEAGLSVRCSYDLCEPPAQTYFTKRNNTFDFYTGFRVDQLPTDFGFVLDRSYSLVTTPDAPGPSHPHWYNYGNVDGSAHTWADPQDLVIYRLTKWFIYPKEASRVDIGVVVRDTEGLLDIFNGYHDPQTLADP